MNDKFFKIAEKIALAAGHPLSFCVAILLVIGWTLTGNYFDWSQRHSLFINTVTTVVTFLLGFLILNTTSRSGRAEQLKLDEIIRAIEKANNNFIKLEGKSLKEVKDIEIKMVEQSEET